jgi:outer membrane cobalamin receptor
LTQSLSASLASLSATDIESLPDVGEDALRAVAWLPGAAGNDISARTSMRGGDADENLVRFDGVRLYQPYHLKDFQNLFSAIDPRIVSSVDVYTSGFPARYGDRMSSVVDITSLSAPAPRYHELSASFFNTTALSAGRFAADRGEWLASARRGNLDVWYHALGHEPGTPNYADAFGKLAWQMDENTRITGSALFSTDELSLSAEDTEERATADYRDAYVWLRLDQTPDPDLSGSTILAHTGLRRNRTGTSVRGGVGSGQLEDHRAFDIASLQSDWSWHARENWLLQFGGEVTRARGRYDYRDHAEFEMLFDIPGAAAEDTRSRSIQLAPRRTDYALYATVRHAFTPQLTTEAGLRWESHAASPRIGARYELSAETSLRASWSRMLQSQSIDELPVSDGVTTFAPPERTDHTAIAIEHRLPYGIEVRAEAYDKRQRHLRPRFESLLNPISLVPELNPDRLRIAPEFGLSRGVELLIVRPRPAALSWWMSFSRALAKERVAGSDVPRAWDQPNAFSAGIDWSTARWNVSVTLMQRSGWPTTNIRLEEAEPVPVVTGERNRARTALFRTVNLRIARSYALDRSALSVFFEVVNALGRDNPCCSTYEIDDETAGLEVERQYGVPRLPSLGFLWQF